MKTDIFVDELYPYYMARDHEPDSNECPVTTVILTPEALVEYRAACARFHWWQDTLQSIVENNR